MKIETKRKIILFFSKLINYQEYKDHAIPFFVKRWEVLHARSQKEFKNDDLQTISDDFIKRQLKYELLEELEKNNAIHYHKFPNRRLEGTTIVADIRFIKSHV